MYPAGETFLGTYSSVQRKAVHRAHVQVGGQVEVEGPGLGQGPEGLSFDTALRPHAHLRPGSRVRL